MSLCQCSPFSNYPIHYPCPVRRPVPSGMGTISIVCIAVAVFMEAMQIIMAMMICIPRANLFISFTDTYAQAVGPDYAFLAKTIANLFNGNGRGLEVSQCCQDCSSCGCHQFFFEWTREPGRFD